MKLVNIIPISFDEVLNIYLEQNGSKKDSWEIENLERADRKFGRWIFAEIPSTEIGKIVMPHYAFGGAHVVPETGAFLNDAYRNFSAERDYFSRNNPQFCERVETQKRIIADSGEVKRIYLSEEPLFTGNSYSGLQRFSGRITHLDGFHRLFALMDSKVRPDFVPSCLALT